MDDLLFEDDLEPSCFVRADCLEELFEDAPKDPLSAIYESWGEDD